MLQPKCYRKIYICGSSNFWLAKDVVLRVILADRQSYPLCGSSNSWLAKDVVLGVILANKQSNQDMLFWLIHNHIEVLTWHQAGLNRRLKRLCRCRAYCEVIGPSWRWYRWSEIM